MKFKKHQKAPIAHSNLTEHENLRSHYDPNGSYTGTPDGWDKTPHDAWDNSERESGRDVYGEYAPTENGYVQEDGNHRYGAKYDAETSREIGAVQSDVAPTDGDSYAENTRDMQDCHYDPRSAGNNMADVEAAIDVEDKKHTHDGDRWKTEKYIDPSPYCDSYVSREHDSHEHAAYDRASRDIEAGNDIYPLGNVGVPTSTNGYPSVPDGELPMDMATIKEDITPVQDSDDL